MTDSEWDEIHGIHIPYLRHFGMCLNDKVAKHPEVRHAVGRQAQLSSVEQDLMLAKKNTPMLVGEAGTGKTDIVEGMAAKLANNDVPDMLKGLQIWNINLGGMQNNIRPPHDKGYFNANLSNIIKECVKYNNKIILFVDEFHTMMMHQGAQLLKPPLARGELKLIGATTNDEFYDFVTTDKAMMRRLSFIPIPEPDMKHTFEILRENKMGSHYKGITMSDKVLHRVVKLGTRYMPHDHYNPDKSFDVMDRTYSEAMVRHEHHPDTPATCTYHDVAVAVYHITNIPMASIAKSLEPQIPHLKQLLEKDVKGQDQAINTVVGAVDTFFAGLNDPTKPKATFLFLGTTGVGKTELAKALAKALFGSSSDMIRLDMASFDTKDATEKLVGVNGKRGVLTEQVRRHPYGILLLDEIEKASPDVWDLLLSILDDGEIQDARGRTVDFTNLVIILTSNLAADTIKHRQVWERGSSQSDEEKKYRNRLFKKKVEDTLKETFRPELVNRFQNIVIFNVLGKAQIVKISRKYIDDLIRRLKKQGFDLAFDFNVIDYLTDLGTDLSNGARPLQRTLSHEITYLLSRIIVNHRSQISQFHTFRLYVKGSRPHKAKDMVGPHKGNLFGTRKFRVDLQVEPITPEQKQERAYAFSDDAIAKMMSLHHDEPDLRPQINARLHHAEVQERQDKI